VDDARWHVRRNSRPWVLRRARAWLTPPEPGSSANASCGTRRVQRAQQPDAPVHHRADTQTRAKVIPFPWRWQGTGDSASFSAHDEKLIRRALTVLEAEMRTPALDYETRARLYFYLGLHRHVIDRWLVLLSADNSSYSTELADKIREAFQYLTSPSILGSEAPTDAIYRGKLAVLSGNIFSSLQLVRSHRCRSDGSSRLHVKNLAC
jgi:hypothetical protein